MSAGDSGPQAEPQVFTKAERRITLAGVMLVFLLSALDNTIVSTAMPRIVTELQGLNLYAWVTTAYMLASTVTVPIYGKLNDIYGRKPVLITGISIFMVGSMLCGLAGEFGPLPILGGGMTQLIVFRAIQGLGGGALFTSAYAIIADLYPPRERAKFGGMFGSVFGLASIIGPLVGGFFTDLGMTRVAGLDVAGWRWIFYVNLPVTALALFMIVAKMPKLTHRLGGRIDFAGAVLLVVTFVPLLLALSWGGREYGWGSAQILGLLALSAAGLAGFLWAESVVAHPILSLSLFRNRVFTTANTASFVSSMAFMGSATFLPLFMQLGQGVAATTSGLSMLPMMLGMIISSTLCGQLIHRTGQYKPFMIAGAVLMATGLFLISRTGVQTTSADIAWRILIMGLGLGPTMSTFNIAVQNAVERSQIGVATSSSQFFRQIGGTVGVAVFGAVLTQRLAGSAPHPGDHAFGLGDLQRLAMASGGEGGGGAIVLPPEVREMVVDALQTVFHIGVGIAICGLLLVLLIPALPLASRMKPPPAEG
jgi:EmrB/QacA subfamily drug resistance transporter